MNNEIERLKHWIEKTESDKYWPNQYNPIPSRKDYLRKKYPEKFEFIENLYDSGYGLKSLAKMFGITYTKMRVIFDLLNIPIRSGRSITTDKLRSIRSENAKNNVNNPFRDWTNKRPELAKTNGRGIQGLYNGVWLRSTYEYIFAKWLDRTNQAWKYEEFQIKTPFGGYRPDFFIYDDNRLSKIVEVKGIWYKTSEDRLKKTKFIQDAYSVPVSVITDVTPFIENGSNYSKEKTKWKEISSQSR